MSNEPYEEKTMRIHLDESLCSGHGRCYTLSPELFEADAEGFPVQRGQDVDVPEGMESTARRAMDNWPEGAIRDTSA